MSDSPLDVIADWPVHTAAAAVVGPSGVLDSHGDQDHRFALASVTKPLVARAAHVAVEEGAIELDTPAGPPGSTVRHLLAHASGLAMRSDEAMNEPGKRRVYSNYGFQVLAETIAQASGITFDDYLRDGVFSPLGMTDSELEGGAEAAGYGISSTMADLVKFAGDLLQPRLVSQEMHRESISVQFPGLDGVLPDSVCNGRTTGVWGSSSRAISRRIGRARPTRRKPSGISVRRGPASGSIPPAAWLWWC